MTWCKFDNDLDDDLAEETAFSTAAVVDDFFTVVSRVVVFFALVVVDFSALVVVDFFSLVVLVLDFLVLVVVFSVLFPVLVVDFLVDADEVGTIVAACLELREERMDDAIDLLEVYGFLLVVVAVLRLGFTA